MGYCEAPSPLQLQSNRSGKGGTKWEPVKRQADHTKKTTTRRLHGRLSKVIPRKGTKEDEDPYPSSPGGRLLQERARSSFHEMAGAMEQPKESDPKPIEFEISRLKANHVKRAATAASLATGTVSP